MKHALSPAFARSKTTRLTRIKSALVLGLISASLVATVPAAQADATSGTCMSYSAYGTASKYHVYANNIDWSKPVGVVYYLDGDYWTTNQSKFYNPANADLTGMAKVANERNMLFVPVESPDKNASGDGITWWEEQDFNGNWFRSFANWFNASKGIDTSNVWTLGYSGGAEVNTFELGADRQTSWRSGGGSIQVGGGGTNGMQTAPSAAAKQLSFQWYAGANDGVGVTYPATWSALGAARQGFASYRASGFQRTWLEVIPGTNHYQYNFPSILRQSLDRGGVQVKQPSTPTLRGAIGAYYYANGAADKFGVPTTGEFGIRDGGAAQEFANNYTIYWREGFGAKPVWFGGGIGSTYRANNFENGHGFPLTAEESSAHGGALQKFSRANGQRFTYYWHPSTGTRVLFENGAIGGKFNVTGGVNGFGYPANNETSVAGGAYQMFRNPVTGTSTAVYWSETTGAHSLNANGAFFHYWKNNGFIEKLGYPTVDEHAIGNGAYSVTFSKGGTFTWRTPQGGVKKG